MIRTLSFAAAASAMLLAGAAQASTLTAAIWTVDKAHSRLGFKGAVEGAGFDGTFHNWDAQISFDPKALATSKVVVTVDLSQTTTGDKDCDQSLPTDEWFGIKRFPRATFTSTKFIDHGGGHYEVDGVLSLKGVSRPVVLPFTLAITGGTAHMVGTAALDRTAFNVGSGRWSTADEVAKAVTVTVDLTAHAGK